MSWAKRTADKYVERGGYAPGTRRERVPDDVLVVASFIGWHDDDHLQGGERAGEAFQAFCRLLNLEPHVIRKIVRGEP